MRVIGVARVRRIGLGDAVAVSSSPTLQQAPRMRVEPVGRDRRHRGMSISASS
jgi:hypothetical protein